MNHSKSVLRSNPRLVPPDTLLKFGISPSASIEFDNAAATLSFSYSGSPKADIGSFGMALRDGEGLVVGHPSQLAMGGNTPEVQVLGTGSSDGRISVGVFEGTDAALRPALEFVRSRATTIGGSNVIVQDNDALAQLEFYADDGVDLTTKAAAFEVEVDDGSPAENAVGAAIILKTMTTGGVLAEALRIDSSQNVGLKATGKLYFDGTGNTYIYEESGDDLHIVVGGQTYMQIDQDLAAGAGGMAIGQNAAPEANGRKHIQIGGTWTASSSGDFGQMVNVGGVLTLDSGVTAHAETLQVSGQIHTQGSSQTIANIASLAVQKPSITVNSGDTVTRASALYIVSVPTEGSTANNGIYMPAGAFEVSDGQGSSGEQLTSGGADGNLTWTAAASVRSSKENIVERTDYKDALAKFVDVSVYDFNYLHDAGRPNTGDFGTGYVGIMADEAPWAMHHEGRILNPINTFGYTVMAFKALETRVVELESHLAEA